MTLPFHRALLATCLLSACLTQRTESVPDPTLSQSDSAANGTMLDASGDSASNGGQTDANAAIACDGDDPCTRADFSRCEKESDTCKPCRASRDCADIAGKTACIKDVGCFECSDDNNTCGGPSPVCHPTRHECVACSASNKTACDANGKVCEPQSGTCVECLANAQCGDASKARCDAGKAECAKCTADDDCKHIAGKTSCNTATGVCVACTSNAQCSDPKASRCDASTNTCMGCGGPNDCTGIKDAVSGEGLAVCANQECVQCTRTAKTACGGDVCNALTKRCADGVAAGSANACGACVSDEQCSAGHACVMTKFGTMDAGYYCQPTTTLNCTGKRPYFKLDAAVTSIDGTTPVDVCTLRVSTCAARAAYSVKDCGIDSDGNGSIDKGDNSLCGDSRFEDGYCSAFQPGVFLCTMPCNGNESDCPAGSGTGVGACADKGFALDACKL